MNDIAKSVRVYVAVGSNLGDAEANVQRAFAVLRARLGPVSVSTLHVTEPVDCPPGSPAFVNAAVGFDTKLAPLVLLALLRAIEAQFGRPALRATNAPRSLDLDIVCYGDLRMETALLTLPHPRAHQRAFVLAPLAELAPFLVLHNARIDALLLGLQCREHKN